MVNPTSSGKHATMSPNYHLMLLQLSPPEIHPSVQSPPRKDTLHYHILFYIVLCLSLGPILSRYAVALSALL